MIGIYHSATSVFLVPHHHHRTSNHAIIYKLMFHFYLNFPPLCKKCDPLGVKHLLSLLESWLLASSTNFKLAWKMVILLTLVTAKHCSD